MNYLSILSIMLIMLVTALFLAGCTKWEEAKLTPRAEAEKARQEYAAAHGFEDDWLIAEEKQEQEITTDKTDENEKAGEYDKKNKYDEYEKDSVEQFYELSENQAKITEPDCDGRLIPTYNIRNEITGYRCETNPANFECDGYRVGEIWAEGNAECTCLADGSIECTEK